MDLTKKICLIVTPSPFLLDERVFMSLGILRIAAVLEEKGISVDVLDLSGIKNPEDVVKDYCSRSKTTCFGITATTPQMPSAVKISKTIYQINGDYKIILGGPHVTLVNAACKKETERGFSGRATRAMDVLFKHFDVLVTGDGEKAIFEAIKENCPRIINADNPKSPFCLSVKELDSLAYPARNLVDIESYKYFIDGERATSLITQLGCPFNCGFCGGRSSHFFRKVRVRSIQNIVNEMVFLYKNYNIKGFMFYDDELNVNPHLTELMNGIRDVQKDLGVQWRLRGFVKSQLFNQEQAVSMYQAGFRWILTGFESGSPKILENINKMATVEDNTRCMEIAKKAGLKVKALMSVGHPGESSQTILETRDWLVKVKPEDFDVSLITVYPGSPYYDEARPDHEKSGIWFYKHKNGDRLYQIDVDSTKVAEYFKGNPDGGYKSFVYTDYLTTQALVEARDFIERDVRLKLNISFNSSSAAMRYEHSMGQLPPYILKESKK